MYDKYKPVRKKGAYNRDKTKKWDGKKWVPVNVVHKGQKATLGGKPVVADGKGNWRSPGTRGNSLEGTKPGRVAGSYQSGDRNRKPNTTSKPSTTSKPGVGRNWSNPHGQKSNKPSEGDRSTWGTKPKPKPDPKPSPQPQPTRTRSSGSTTRPTTTTTTTTTPKPTPTAKPKPAGKVYGSTGRKDLKQSARMADALKTLKVRDYGGSKKKPAAKPKPTPEPKVSRPKPPSSLSKPKPTASKPKPTATKPKPAKQKPLVVPTNQIPKNLNSPAGRKYIADLDAGKLTRKRK